MRIMLVALCALAMLPGDAEEERCCGSEAFVPAPQDAPWAKAKKGRVKGTIEFAKGPRTYPVVVYLERKGAPLEFAPPAPLRVSQKGATFRPNFAVLVRGQKAIFLNDEPADIGHNVHFLGQETSDLGIIERGGEAAYTFAKSGEIVLRCSIHKFMDGRFFVAPTPAFAEVSGGSEFAIEGVPAGRYTLRTYQRTRRFYDAEMEVDVREGATADVTVVLTR